MGKLHLEDVGDGVFVISMKDGENLFNPDFISEMNQVLGKLEKDENIRALITVGEGKFYSNGLDLAWLEKNPSQLSDLLFQYHALLSRLITFQVPTIAAINGHAFAGGLMFAFAHDFRIMRSDRGYLCLPEIDLGMPLTPGMTAVIQYHILRDAILLGKRFNSEEALKANIIDQSVPQKEVLPSSIELARKVSPKGTNHKVVRALKERMYHRAMSALLSGGTGDVIPPPSKL